MGRTTIVIEGAKGVFAVGVVAARTCVGCAAISTSFALAAVLGTGFAIFVVDVIATSVPTCGHAICAFIQGALSAEFIPEGVTAEAVFSTDGALAVEIVTPLAVIFCAATARAGAGPTIGGTSDTTLTGIALSIPALSVADIAELQRVAGALGVPGGVAAESVFVTDRVCAVGL